MNTSLPMLLNFSSIGYNLLGRKNIRQINFMYCLTKLRIMTIYQSCLNITVFVQNWFENGEIKQVQTVQNQRRDLSSTRRVILWSLYLVLLLCKWCLSETLRIGGTFCQEECLATTLCVQFLKTHLHVTWLYQACCLNSSTVWMCLQKVTGREVLLVTGVVWEVQA